MAIYLIADRLTPDGLFWSSGRKVRGVLAMVYGAVRLISDFLLFIITRNYLKLPQRWGCVAWADRRAVGSGPVRDLPWPR